MSGHFTVDDWDDQEEARAVARQHNRDLEPVDADDDRDCVPFTSLEAYADDVAEEHHRERWADLGGDAA